MESNLQFNIGQLVEHKLFGYRGVIFDVDAVFMLSDEWYEIMTRSRPPRNHPWYHVMVDHALGTTYVAQRNLQAAHEHEQVDHPLLGHYFKHFTDGHYVSRHLVN